LGTEEEKPLPKFLLDGQDSSFDGMAWGYIMGCGKNGTPSQPVNSFPCKRIYCVDGFDPIVINDNPVCILLLIGWKNINILSSDSELAPVKICVISLILTVDKLVKEHLPCHILALFKNDKHPVVCLGRAQAIDA